LEKLVIINETGVISITNVLTKKNIEKSWVYQSNRLIEASYHLTLMEQKMLRILASMIKKNDEDFKFYEFKATDLAEVLDIDIKNIYRELDRVTDLMMSRFIKVKIADREGYEKYHLVKQCSYDNGKLKICIDSEMKPFYFGLDWYSKYQIKNIMQFKSSYSFRFYEWFKQYETIGERTITIDEMRLMLEIGKKEYPLYANLKQKVINPALSEINEKTDLYITFDKDREIKSGRKVVAIKFKIESSKRKGAETFEIPESNEEIIGIFEESIQDQETAITLDETMQALVKQTIEIMKNKIDEHDALTLLKLAKNDLKTINEKYFVMKDYASRGNNIESIMSFMCDAISKDYKASRSIKSQANKHFNNAGKGYASLQCNDANDLNNLEKRLLGRQEVEENEISEEEKNQYTIEEIANIRGRKLTIEEVWALEEKTVVWVETTSTNTFGNVCCKNGIKEIQLQGIDLVFPLNNENTFNVFVDKLGLKVYEINSNYVMG
jgi:plasmid replication initiation protein